MNVSPLSIIIWFWNVWS